MTDRTAFHLTPATRDAVERRFSDEDLSLSPALGLARTTRSISPESADLAGAVHGGRKNDLHPSAAAPAAPDPARALGEAVQMALASSHAAGSTPPSSRR